MYSLVLTPEITNLAATSNRQKLLLFPKQNHSWISALSTKKSSLYFMFEKAITYYHFKTKTKKVASFLKEVYLFLVRTFLFLPGQVVVNYATYSVAQK